MKKWWRQKGPTFTRTWHTPGPLNDRFENVAFTITKKKYYFLDEEQNVILYRDPCRNGRTLFNLISYKSTHRWVMTMMFFWIRIQSDTVLPRSIHRNFDSDIDYHMVIYIRLFYIKVSKTLHNPRKSLFTTEFLPAKKNNRM